jgi:hypothetical protein
MKTDGCVFIAVQFLLELDIYRTKVVEKIKKSFMLNIFPQNRALYKIM